MPKNPGTVTKLTNSETNVKGKIRCIAASNHTASFIRPYHTLRIRSAWGTQVER